MTPNKAGSLRSMPGLGVAVFVTTVALGSAAAERRFAPAGDGLTTLTSPRMAGQSAIQRRVQEFLVTFEITQSGETNASSADQVSILFSNRSLDGPEAPTGPTFGDDILEEFSFSGLDIVGGQLQFSRRVRDRSFLDARYVRVVNHGGDGWGAGAISMAVDGEPILKRVGMSKRKGQAGKGLQDWNKKNWRQRSYWEAELQALAMRRMAK